MNTRDDTSHGSRHQLVEKRGKNGGGQRWLPLALWFLVVASVAGISRLPADRPVLTLPLEVKGEVLVTIPRREGRQSVQAGQPFPAGSRVTISPGGTVTLSLLPGIVARADDPADFSVDALTMRKSDTTVESRYAEVDLHAGKLRFSVIMPEDGNSSLRVSTAEGTINSQPGSLFSVATTAGKVRVVCSWGALQWQRTGDQRKSTVLLAGEFYDENSFSSAAGGSHKVLEDADAQDEMAEMLRIGTLINALERAQIFRPPPFLPKRD